MYLRCACILLLATSPASSAAAAAAATHYFDVYGNTFEGSFTVFTLTVRCSWCLLIHTVHACTTGACGTDLHTIQTHIVGLFSSQ
jgi:hypothetical protein